MNREREHFDKGAWLGAKLCPNCGGVCAFAIDFQKLGHHQLRACVPCKGVFVDGELMETLTVPAKEG